MLASGFDAQYLLESGNVVIWLGLGKRDLMMMKWRSGSS